MMDKSGLCTDVGDVVVADAPPNGPPPSRNRFVIILLSVLAQGFLTPFLPVAASDR